MSLMIDGRRAVGGGSMHNYSTTEHVVGTWIDGSTLYERTYDLGSDVDISNSSWTSSGITISNLNKILSASSTNSGGTFYPLMAYHQNGSVNLLACRSGSGGTASSRYVTLQYTKSS